MKGYGGWMMAGGGIVLFVLMAAYMLMTPLSVLLEFGEADGAWVELVTSFKQETREVSEAYGYYDPDNIAIIPGEVEVVYYSQKDPAWANVYYDTRRRKTQTIRSGGCGPSSLAIVYSSLTQEKKTPYDMAVYAMRNGYCAAPSGSYRSLFTRGAEGLGLTNYYSGESLSDALEQMTEGRLAVALMGKGIFCDGGHFVVIRGVTEDGKILLADCWNERNNEKEWDMNTIARNLKTDGNNCLWVLGWEKGDEE